MSWLEGLHFSEEKREGMGYGGAEGKSRGGPGSKGEREGKLLLGWGIINY